MATNENSSGSSSRIDVTKFLDQMAEKVLLAKERTNAFLDGYMDCRDEVVQMLDACIDPDAIDDKSYVEGANQFIYRLCKELGIPSQDIRESGYSIDEKAALLAERIKEECSNEKASFPNTTE